MTEITLKGNTINTVGELPAVGSAAPSFSLTGGDLGERTLADYAGKSVLLNIFPSVDAGVCAASVREFNQLAAAQDATVLCISADLPFAHGRFCGAEGIEGVENLSTFRSPGFGTDYGVAIVDGPMAGLMSRAVVVVDAEGNVAYAEQVPEIVQEPDYAAAMAAL